MQHHNHNPFKQQCSIINTVINVVFWINPLWHHHTSYSATALKQVTKETMATVSITKGGPEQVNKDWDSPDG